MIHFRQRRLKTLGAASLNQLVEAAPPHPSSHHQFNGGSQKSVRPAEVHEEGSSRRQHLYYFLSL